MSNERNEIRKSVVAGTWYPASASALRLAVDRYLDAATDETSELGSVVALVAPHAGLIYSGPVAAHAYRQLSGCDIELAVLVGPSHFVAFDGIAIVASGGFETPIGIAQIDEPCARALLEATPAVHEHAAAHAREHSLEMQLPFLLRVAPQAKIIPLVMGYQTADTADALGAALAAVLPGRKAVLVASTDLSHYHDARTAAALDSIVIDHIGRFDADGLQRTLDAKPDHACGGGPTVAVMRAAARLGAARARILKYADSGDVTGDKSAVVGYLAAVLRAPAAAVTTQ